MSPVNPCLQFPVEALALLEILSSRRLSASSPLDQEKFWEICGRHELRPLVFKQSINSGIPREKIHSGFKYSYLSNLARNRTLWKEFVAISSRLRGSGVAVVPIKGMDILARFYPEMDTRLMVDIDLLVKPEDYNKAESILLAMDYQKELSGLKESYWRKKQCHIAFRKNEVLVEVHWMLDLPRKTRNLESIWERTREKTTGSDKVLLLSVEDAFLALALHLRRFGNILCLKQINDAARLINETTEFDWEYILREIRQGKMRATLNFFLSQLIHFTDARIPSGLPGKLSLGLLRRRLTERFILAKTFDPNAGLKDNYLKAHFLLYDGTLEPFLYVIGIPYEQFCKFYDLTPYVPLSDLYYRLRFLYIPLKQAFAK